MYRWLSRRLQTFEKIFIVSHCFCMFLLIWHCAHAEWNSLALFIVSVIKHDLAYFKKKKKTMEQNAHAELDEAKIKLTAVLKMWEYFCNERRIVITDPGLSSRIDWMLKWMTSTWWTTETCTRQFQGNCWYLAISDVANGGVRQGKKWWFHVAKTTWRQNIHMGDDLRRPF